MNNLSVGVKSIFSEVNCLSKLLTSLRCFCEQNFESKSRPITLDEPRYAKITYDFRFKRRLHFAILDFLPVDSPEKRVPSDVFFASRAASQPFMRRLRQQLSTGERLLKKKIRARVIKLPSLLPHLLLCKFLSPLSINFSGN